MSITVLAIVFLAIVLLVALLGFKAIIRQGKPAEELNMEKCSLCRGQFHKSQLIERQIGDYRLYYFCQNCISGLYNEMVSKN